MTEHRPGPDSDLVTTIADVHLSGPRRGGSSDAERVDVLLEDGSIVAIRPADPEVLRSSDPGVLDGGGGFLLPGLWDHHVHFTQWARTARRVDLSSAASAAEAVELVAERIAQEADGDGWVEGARFRDALWPDTPTFALLDAIAPDREVVLVSADLHCCWLNSAALRATGFADHPTGLLREEESFAVLKQLDQVADELSDRWVDAAADQAASRGVVGVVDLEMRWNAADWIRRVGNGTRALRISFGVYAEHLERAIDAGLVTGGVLAGTDGLVQVGPFKVITDGSLNTRTACCDAPYPGSAPGTDAHGMLNVPPERLTALLTLATANGLHCAVHAIGDRANTLALDAIETTGARGTIEHAQLLRASDLERFARTGTAASVQPEHAMDDRDIAEVHWAGRTDRAFVLRSLLDAGATLRLGSDAPVAPLDPWVSIAAAVTRSRDGREAWHGEQAITVEEALAASTRGDDDVVAVGRPADLVVVPFDPFSCAPEALRTMPVRATMLGGRLTAAPSVHAAGG